MENVENFYILKFIRTFLLLNFDEDIIN